MIIFSDDDLLGAMQSLWPPLNEPSLHGGGGIDESVYVYQQEFLWCP